MRAVPWLLARVNPQIPTAVFTSPDRGTGAWLRGRTRQILPAASLPDIARHCQILPNIAQILPDIARYCPILPDIARNAFEPSFREFDGTPPRGKQYLAEPCSGERQSAAMGRQ
jgi:hypothetical protein